MSAAGCQGASVAGRCYKSNDDELLELLGNQSLGLRAARLGALMNGMRDLV